MKTPTILLPLLLASTFLATPALAADLPQIPQFIDEMVAKHQFQRDELVEVFQRAQHRPEIIAAITLPATTKPWPEYRASFVNDKRISGGVEFWQNHATTLQRAEQEYGVPQEIIVAIIGVETLYGRHAGRFSTLDALTTLAFDFPRRAPFFRSELEHYLLLAREQSWELFKVPSSYAGAMGIPQFMPSSYRKHAVDFNGDGKIDLIGNPTDAIGSVANYLKQYGWLSGEPVAMLTQPSGLDITNISSNLSGNFAASSVGTTQTLAAWAQSGVRPATGLLTSGISIPRSALPKNMLDEKSARLLAFTLTEGSESWLAFKNFQVITLYNNSNFYAMTVHQLAEEIRAAKEKNERHIH